MDIFAKSIDIEINEYLKSNDSEMTLPKARLVALELISKAGAGFYMSGSEEFFLNSLKVLRKDRMPNKRGRTFICGMAYAGSNERPHCFELMRKYRN